MKLKLFLSIVFSLCIMNEAFAVDAGLRYIATRGKVICGTNLEAKTYAFKNEDGKWQGIDSDLCQIFSTAVFGRSDRFEMVNIQANEVEKALKSNQIDVMLGGSPYSAGIEVAAQSVPAGVVYYDNQVFLARKLAEASSMEAYKESRICAVIGSTDFANIQEYGNRYNLDFKLLMFPSLAKAREAFLLKRCDLFSADEIYLKGVLKGYPTSTANVMIIPEVIGTKPVYALVEGDNKTLAVIIKWVLNSLTLAEKKGINSTNADIFVVDDNASIQNLLGVDDKLWKKFKLDPEWVKKAIAEFGNYAEIYERNIGKNSELEIKRDKNNLIENGGLINPQPFL